MDPNKLGSNIRNMIATGSEKDTIIKFIDKINM